MTKMAMYGNGIEGRQAAAPCTPHPSPFNQPSPRLRLTSPQPSTLNISTSQQGFTLVELLIVTVVIVALMGIMFRLTGIVGGTNERQITITRMQRLENCLSGYYAAFGQYPPVPLQGASYNIFQKVCSLHEIQYGDEDDSELDADRVRAACRAQPVAALYPPAERIPLSGNSWSETMTSDEALENYQQAVKDLMGSYHSDDSSMMKRAQRLASAWGSNPIRYQMLATQGRTYFEGTSDFTQFSMFRFGLMSFLLPRYRFMLESAKPGGPFHESIDKCKQWTDFNVLPAHMVSGVSYESWGKLSGGSGGSSSIFTERLGSGDIPNENERWEIDLIPSQAACARWMPNLAGIVSGPSNCFFGVMIAYDRNDNGFNISGNVLPTQIRSPYSIGSHGQSCGTSSPFMLCSMTVKDGWGNDFYYYSPPPYQSYILWSSGGWSDLTFPPWIDMNEFKRKYSKFFETALRWAKDDIIYMGTGEK